MKVSVTEKDSEPKVVQVGNDPAVAGPEVDRASLWTLLAILFFGAFLMMFVLLNRAADDGDIDDMNGINDTNDINDTLDEPIDVDDNIDMDDSGDNALDTPTDVPDSSSSSSSTIEE